MNKKKIKIWMTYDLGVGGDYQGMYAWLDDKSAIECGSNNSFFTYEFSDKINSDKDLVRCLRDELEQNVKFRPMNRVYAIWKSMDEGRKGNNVGQFILGKRKANPWEGFGSKSDNSVDE